MKWNYVTIKFMAKKWEFLRILSNNNKVPNLLELPD